MNRLDLVSSGVGRGVVITLTLFQLVDAARGIEYLHQNLVAHGDSK